jgi:glycerol-3-phosphate dehydrogenase
MKRRDPTRLEREKFDLLIVGGGISGATLAWDASLRGLKVALVDKGDFGGATSSATSKLIHGGLRYLKNGEVRLVRESLRERRILQGVAGHLVRPIPFLIPTFKRGNRKWMIKSGMLAYDLLGYDRRRLEDPAQRLPGHHMLSGDQVLTAEPSVPAADLTGGAVYYDCQCDPDRLTLEFIIGASRNGALVINYAQVGDLACRLGHLDSAEVRDLLSGKSYEVKARMTANVAGPWADHVDLLCGAGDKITLKRSKGIHIITRPLTKEFALVMQTEAGRHFFIIPWRGHSLIGTTDTEYQGEPDDLGVQAEDVQQFVDEINQACPAAKLNAAAVKYRYVGVRPLVDQETQVYEASRRYEIVDHHSRGLKGYISALGGKYTTSRNLARKLTNRILARLDEPKVSCRTAHKLLPGSVSGSFDGYVDKCCQEERSLLPADVLRHLIWTYGARHDDVLDLVRDDSSLAERVCEGRPEIMAQVAFAVHSEMACRLVDIVSRRTGIATLGDPGDEAMNKVAGLAARLLDWGSERREQEINVCREKIKGLPETNRSG